MTPRQIKKADARAKMEADEAERKAFNDRQKLLRKRKENEHKAALKAQPTWRKVLRHVVSWGLMIAIVGGLAAAIFIGGLGIAFVRTGSMRPTYMPGDLLVVVDPQYAQPKIGDVIVATPKIGADQLPAIAHRIISQNEDGSWTTKGDYNPQPDAWRDHPENIQKTVVGHIPMGWASNPLAIGLGCGIAAMFLFWPSKQLEDDGAELDEDGNVIDLSDQPKSPESHESQTDIDLTGGDDSDRELAGTASGKR